MNKENRNLLKHFWTVEVTKNRPYSLFRAFSNSLKSRKKNFYFKYRLAYVLHRSSSKWERKLAEKINKSLMNQYALDISLDADIKEGLTLAHFTGIVITGYASIGKNCTIRQNTTLGVDNKDGFISIGDNVQIGANSCIMAKQPISIGDNVTLGAMSFINKDIPSDTTFITKKESNSWPNKPLKTAL